MNTSTVNMHIALSKRDMNNTTGYMRTFSILNDCSTIGQIPCVVYSCNRDPIGELRPQTPIGRSLIPTWVCTLQAVYTALFGLQLRMTIETHLPYGCIVPIKCQFSCKWCIILSYFQLIVYTNITIVYTVLQLCCQAARKEKDKLGVKNFL